MKDSDPKAAAPAPDPARRPGRLSWLYEAPVFYAALVAFQRLSFPDNPFWYGVTPSPAWVGVLLFAMRYGLVSGLACGALSAALGALGARAAGEAYRFSDLDYYVEPGLLLIVGAAIGGAADGYMSRIGDLVRRLEELTERAQGLQQHIVSQQKAMRVVEQQVVSQMSSVVTLYHGSRSLGRLERAELYDAMLDFFTRALQAGKTALYLPQDGAWALSRQRGWAEDDRFPRLVAPGAGVVGRAALERKPASLRDWLVGSFEAGATLPDQTDAIMAAPILTPDGEPAAVFAVHAMPFLRFNSASLNLLSLLADWGTEAYAKCLSVEELKARSIMDEEFGVHSQSYFGSRTRQEFTRSARHALPFSVILVAPSASPELPADRRLHYLKAVCRLLKEAAREGDVVARTDRPGAEFGLILPTTTKETAELLRRRLLDSAAAIGLPSGLKAGVGSFAHTMKEVSELFEQAESDLR